MAEPAPKPTDPASDRLFDGSTVLVVEDQGDSRDMMRQMLEALGHLKEDPDLILCDLLMPRIDGFTLVERLPSDPRRRPRPSSPSPASGYDSDYRRTWEAGFDGHLVKPIDIEIVIETLRRHLPSGARRAPRGVGPQEGPSLEVTLRRALGAVDEALDGAIRALSAPAEASSAINRDRGGAARRRRPRAPAPTLRRR